MIEVVLAFLGLFKLQVLSGNLVAGKAADQFVVKNICPAIFFLVSCPGGKPCKRQLTTTPRPPAPVEKRV